MFIEIILSLLIGICFGIITGIIPGIHINLISAILLGISSSLIYTSPLNLSVFIISMSVTHTFIDAIPSIFLGAPDSSQALGVLPGHRYLLKGKGLRAVKLTAIGSYGAIIVSIILFPIFILFVKYLYPYLEIYVKYFIVIVIIFMILKDKKKLWSIIIFIISGVLGIIVLSSNTIQNPLFPMLSGMFGISTLIYSLNDGNIIPKQQEYKELPISLKLYIKAIFSGCFSGFLTAVTPALGAGMAAAISSIFTKNLGDKGFMILIGSISTFNFVLSLVTYYTIDKARNGSIIVVQKLLNILTKRNLIVILVIVLIVGSIALFLTYIFARIFMKFISKVNYKKLTFIIIILIIFMTLLLSKLIGLIILITSTAIGLIPAIKKATRTMAMGCLMLPVLLFLFKVI